MGADGLRTNFESNEEPSTPVVAYTPLEPPPTRLLRGDSEMMFPLEINTVLEDAKVEEQFDEGVEKAQKAVETLQLDSPDPTDD